MLIDSNLTETLLENPLLLIQKKILFYTMLETKLYNLVNIDKWDRGIGATTGIISSAITFGLSAPNKHIVIISPIYNTHDMFKSAMHMAKALSLRSIRYEIIFANNSRISFYPMNIDIETRFCGLSIDRTFIDESMSCINITNDATWDIVNLSLCVHLARDGRIIRVW